ncbi:response regulator transcription factor [Nocardia transvalensis]|uniref:response regulator transcription factor n=1 Tax=Nocardia transvalensis TaxID=37333 RepID=UPI0018933A67|nr:response regulator transcription factor [Nocardia transvalensis]MBF6333035.1 response regulator transcription factor [Nocardia transvalensis]
MAVRTALRTTALHNRHRHAEMRKPEVVRPRTLMVVSDSPFARMDFGNAVAAHDGFALAGTCAWSEAVDRSARWRPEVIVLDASVRRLADLASTVARLRELEHSPMITLLVEHGATKADIGQVDAAVIKDCGVLAVLEVLNVLISGAVLAVAPQRDRVHTDAMNYQVRQRLAMLTKREREILRLIVEGLSNREIGARLFLSQETVKEYVSRVLSKLGVSSRIEAAVAAVRAGFDDR